MTNGIALRLAKLASRLPRGGFPVVRYLSRLMPQLRHIEIPTRYGKMYCDLAESVCMPLLKHGGYQHTFEEDEFCRSALTPDSVVFDIGANIGVTSLQFARIAKTVHAFEPSPKALRLLRANVAHLDNVVIHEVALSDENATVKFSEWDMLDQSRIGPTGFDIQAVTGDSLGIVPTFVKIDIEGHEQAAFRGMTAILATGPDVLFEAKTDRDREEIEDILSRANAAYRFRAIGGKNRNFIAQVPRHANADENVEALSPGDRAIRE